MIVHLLRHAVSTAPAGVAGGWTDWPLAEAGHAMARAASTAWPWPAPPRLLASDLERAVATARPFAERHGIACITDARLRETNLGDWEGRTWAGLEREQAQRLARWYRDWRTEGPPGGESFADVVARVRAFLADLDAQPHTLVVAHAGSIRALLVASGAHDVETAMRLPLQTLCGYTLDLRAGVAVSCQPLMPAGLPVPTPAAARHPDATRD